MALSFLLETIVGSLEPSLSLVKLEGDAVFAYRDATRAETGDPLLTVIARTYRAFRDRAITLRKGTPCLCRACEELPTLDLKFVVHHGDYVIQRVAGSKDLLGAAVTLVHRLTKNSVAATTGWRGYVLFTRDGLEQTGADPGAFVQQREFYEHFGDVDTFVMDLSAGYDSAKAGRP